MKAESWGEEREPMFTPPFLLVAPPQHFAFMLPGIGGGCPGPLKDSCMKVTLHFVSCKVFLGIASRDRKHSQVILRGSCWVTELAWEGTPPPPTFGLSSLSYGEAAWASGCAGDVEAGGPGWNCQTPTVPNKCVTRKKNLGPKGSW